MYNIIKIFFKMIIYTYYLFECQRNFLSIKKDSKCGFNISIIILNLPKSLIHKNKYFYKLSQSELVPI